MVQCAKLLTVASGMPFQRATSSSDIPFWIHFPATAPEKAVEDSPSTWGPVTRAYMGWKIRVWENRTTKKQCSYS